MTWRWTYLCCQNKQHLTQQGQNVKECYLAKNITNKNVSKPKLLFRWEREKKKWYNTKILEVLFIVRRLFVHNTKNTKRLKNKKKIVKFRFYFQTKFLNYINNSAENSIYLMLKEVTVCLIKLFFVHIAAK